MIFSANSGNTGKTGQARVNSYASLGDRVKVNARFGSLPSSVDRMYNAPDFVSVKSNSPIPLSWLMHDPNEIIELDYDIDKINQRGRRYEMYLYTDCSYNRDNDFGQMLRYRKIPLSSVPFLDRGAITRLTSVNDWDDFVRLANPRGVYYYKLNDYAVYHPHNHCWHDYMLSGPVCYVLIREFNSEPYYYDTTVTTRAWNAQVAEGLMDESWFIAAIGFISYMDNDGNYYVSFASDHFTLGLDFVGLPYIAISENGPNPALGYGSALRDEPRFLQSRMNYIQRYRNSIDYEPRSAMHDLFGSPLRKYSDMYVNEPRNAIIDILRCNRCFIDSVSNILYSPGGNTMAGGISSEVVMMLMATQLSECIGLYSPLDVESPLTSSSNDIDPILNKIKEAHLCGLLFYNKDKFATRCNFTTRNTDNRSTQYSLFDENFVYGNKLVCSKNGVNDDNIRQVINEQRSITMPVRVYNGYHPGNSLQRAERPNITIGRII